MKTYFVSLKLIVSILLFTSPLQAQESLVISRAESTRPTYGIGLGSERVLKETYSRIGINIEFLYLPTERSLITSNNGETDGEFSRVAGIERKYPNLVRISVPLKYLDVVVYTKNIEFKVKDWQSLAPYTIGIVRGFKLAELNTKGMKVEMVNTEKQAFLKLDADRNDVFVGFRLSQCQLNKLEVSGIKILEPPLARIAMYHYLHKRHMALASKLEKVMMKMDQDGVIERIRKKADQDIQELCQ